MQMKLIRNQGTKGFTEGKLYINDVFECYTVEDEVRVGEKIYGQTAIPAGTYKVTMTMSNRFKKVLPILHNVPNYTGVRIHSGNSSKDTEGCIIVGSENKSDKDNWVAGSRVALATLLPKIQKAIDNKENVTIEIV